MAALTAAGSAIKAAAAPTVLQPKVDAARPQLRTGFVCKSFGLAKSSSRLTCSLQQDAQSFASKAMEVSKVAATAIAASALLAQSAMAGPPRLTFDEINSKTYLEVKGSGTANQCPILVGGKDGFLFSEGKYKLQKLCLEPTQFLVKAESQFKGSDADYTKTKLMTRLTYTLDEIEGSLDVNNDGTVKFEEKDGIDYAAVTVQLPGGERVPFLFTIKELVASGKPSAFGGSFLVPSYRGSSFLDPKGRGGSTGYDNAVALPAGGTGDSEELAKENQKSTKAAEGNIVFSVAQSNNQTGEVVGTFESVQPSDTDLGAKAAKERVEQPVFDAAGLRCCRSSVLRGSGKTPGDVSLVSLRQLEVLWHTVVCDEVAVRLYYGGRLPTCLQLIRLAFDRHDCQFLLKLGIGRIVCQAKIQPPHESMCRLRHLRAYTATSNHATDHRRHKLRFA